MGAASAARTEAALYVADRQLARPPCRRDAVRPQISGAMASRTGGSPHLGYHTYNFVRFRILAAGHIAAGFNSL